MVVSIADNGPAAGALLPGDIVLEAGGTAVSGPRALAALLGPETVGTSLAIRLLRGGEVIERAVTVAARPA